MADELEDLRQYVGNSQTADDVITASRAGWRLEPKLAAISFSDRGWPGFRAMVMIAWRSAVNICGATAPFSSIFSMLEIFHLQMRDSYYHTSLIRQATGGRSPPLP